MTTLLHCKTLKSSNVADQCREFGLVVGDTIEGRQEYEFRGKKCWNEVRLTLIWIGQIAAAWMHSERNNHTRVNWSEPVETVAWDLSDRIWRKLEKEAR